MKKFFTLFAALLLTSVAFAQDEQEELDETFVFTDLEGNVVADGSVIVVDQLNGEGQMVVPLKVKNVSGDRAAVSMYEVIDAIPNGDWQTCAFGNCMNLYSTGYSPKNIEPATYFEGIQTEWIPEAGKYATWEATLQIHVFNIAQQFSFGQYIDVAGNEIIGYGPKVTVRFEYKDPDAKPATQQVWWGNVEEGADVIGLGVQTAETYDCASYFAGNHSIVGGKAIKSVRFKLLAPNVENVKVWLSDTLPSTIDKENVAVLVPVKNVQTGDNIVELPSAYTVGDKGVFVGYSFTITAATTNADKYPVPTAGNDLKNALWLRTSTSVPSWSDMNGNNFGRLYLQMLLDGEFAYANGASIAVSDIGETVAAIGGKGTAFLPLTNEGTQPLQSIDYTITTDGVAGPEQHLDLENAIAFASMQVVKVSVTGDAEAGVKEKTLTVTKVNGTANEYATAETDLTLSTVAKVVDRVVAVEEYTGTTCGWCPRGIVGMEKIGKEFGEKVAAIAIHRYTASTAYDAMYISTYNQVSFSGAPSARIDRGAAVDPYYGSSSSIIDDINFELSIPAKAAITVTGEWSQDGKQVNATSTIENVMPGNSYKIEYVLVADSLTGETQAWRQHNYYHSAYGNYTSKEQLPTDLAFLINTGQIFGSGSNAYVAYYPVFNDVAIAVAKSTQTTAPGELAVGEPVTNSYTLSMPTNTTLLNAISTDKVSVVALLINADGTIANAAKFRLPKYEDTSGIQTATTRGTSDTVARYSLDGRRLSAPQKGLNIVKMADGRIVKTIVR